MAGTPREVVPLIPAMRRLLLVAALLVFLAGSQLYVFPLRTADWFAWTVEPPMTAVFLGAAYWASAVLEIAGARSASWDRARLAVWTVFVFTTLTLLVTLLHLDRFHLTAEHPFSARAVTWGWLAIYTSVPAAMLVIAWRQTRHGRGTGRPGAATLPLAPGLRVLLVGLAVVLLTTGAALLVAPVEAAALWPWPLTELTARAVGAWLVGLGWAAAHAWFIDDVPAVRPLGLTGAAFVALQVTALVRHGGDLDWAAPSGVGYLVVLLGIGTVAGWILAAGRVRAAAAAGSAGTP